jgi:DNA-directed RNA polymerase specialized sigma24 family protein
MVCYQQADPEAPTVLVRGLSPVLLSFFRSQFAIREQADDLLQETWLRIHRVRHTYRPGEPLLPWVFAIAPGRRRWLSAEEAHHFARKLHGFALGAGRKS